MAKPGEVLVSSTVKDLVIGSGLAFDDRGLHALKGVPDTGISTQWQAVAEARCGTAGTAAVRIRLDLAPSVNFRRACAARTPAGVWSRHGRRQIHRRSRATASVARAIRMIAATTTQNSGECANTPVHRSQPGDVHRLQGHRLSDPR